MLLRRILIILSFVSFGVAEIPHFVVTDLGWIKGKVDFFNIDGELKFMYKYLGIPYAKSTAGDNRFKKSVPRGYFTRTFDATKLPKACFQQTRYEMDILKQKYGVPGFSEDCLSLNIYSPYQNNRNIKLPVMVWIHGGGFRQGAASMYEPEGLASYGNVVVVTINYRVGMFGFLSDSNGTVMGNQGLWDQHLALKWVHDNIHDFNGDQNDVTIFGQEAGGVSALLQAMYPGNKRLFKRVIAESGTPLSPWAIKDISDSEKYLQDIGCPPNTNDTLKCMQSKHPNMLLHDKANLGPVVDGVFLKASPEEILLQQTPRTAHARDAFALIDVLLGFNDMDGVFYYNKLAKLLNKTSLDFNVTRTEFDEKVVPDFVRTMFSKEFSNDTRYALTELLTFFYTDWTDPTNVLTIRDTLTAMLNDHMFFVPAIHLAQAHAVLRQKNTYIYEFSVQSDKHALAPPPWLKGSYHCDEIPYVFGFPLRESAFIFGQVLTNYTNEEKQISRTVMAFWSNFAKSGNPNAPMNVAHPWHEYNMTSQDYYQISNHMSAASVKDLENFHPRRMAFWSYLIPNLIELLQSATTMTTEEITKTLTDTVHIDISLVPVK